MAKKKTDEVEETVQVPEENAAVEETPAETVAEMAEAAPEQVAEAADVKAEEAPVKKAAKPKKAAKEADKAPAADAGKGKRAEKIGVVASDLMTKTVTVRVDRLVKHPIYRKYVRKRKKFMAHDELGAKIGDKVRIIETRPLSARKRWRVIEIIQKAAR